MAKMPESEKQKADVWKRPPNQAPSERAFELWNYVWRRIRLTPTERIRAISAWLENDLKPAEMAMFGSLFLFVAAAGFWAFRLHFGTWPALGIVVAICVYAVWSYEDDGESDDEEALEDGDDVEVLEIPIADPDEGLELGERIKAAAIEKGLTMQDMTEVELLVTDASGNKWPLDDSPNWCFFHYPLLVTCRVALDTVGMGLSEEDGALFDEFLDSELDDSEGSREFRKKVAQLRARGFENALADLAESIGEDAGALLNGEPEPELAPSTSLLPAPSVAAAPETLRQRKY